MELIVTQEMLDAVRSQHPCEERFAQFSVGMDALSELEQEDVFWLEKYVPKLVKEIIPPLWALTNNGNGGGRGYGARGDWKGDGWGDGWASTLLCGDGCGDMFGYGDGCGYGLGSGEGRDNGAGNGGGPYTELPGGV